MRLDGTELYDGYISACDLDNDLSKSLVSVMFRLDLSKVHWKVCPIYGEVLAVGRDTSGNIVVKIVELNGDSRVSEDDKDLCSKISEVHLHDDTTISFYFCYAWRQQK